MTPTRLRLPRERVHRRRLALALVGLLLVALLLLVGVVRVLYWGQALPGTEAAGVALGGASREEVADRLRPVLGRDREIALVAEDGDERLRVRSSQLGYRPDRDGTVDAVLDAGRSGPLQGVVSTLTGLVAGRTVALAGEVDRSTLRRTVASIARRVDDPPFPGRITISDADLSVSTEPPRTGAQVDRRELTASLREAVLRQDDEPVTLPVRRREVGEAGAVTRVGLAAERYLEQPLTLTGSGTTYTVRPDQLAPALGLQASDGGREVRLGTRKAQLAALVAEVAEARDRAPRDARMSAPGRTVTVDGKDDLSWRPRKAEVRVRPARAGRAVLKGPLAKAIDTAVRKRAHTAKLPIRTVRPQVAEAAARRADQLIGTFTTRYEPGQPRVTNIRRIAREVDGTVVAPGEQFSLNAASVPRTEAKGYVEAPYIADGRIQPSVGGGVSQFSTTLYNAVYFAGLKIDDFRPHSLYIDRYPPGREATLNDPGIELLWTNDTKVPVLLRAVSDATSVTVSLYGSNGGRKVRAEHGDQQPVAGGDFQIEVTRVISYADGRTERQPRTTRYDLEAPDPAPGAEVPTPTPAAAPPAAAPPATAPPG